MSFLALLIADISEWLIEKGSVAIPKWIEIYKQVTASQKITANERDLLKNAKTPEETQDAAKTIASDLKSK